MPKKLMNLPKKLCLNCNRELQIKINRDINRKNFCCRSCSSIYNIKYKNAGMVGKNHSESSKRIMSLNRIGKLYSNGRGNFRKRLLLNFDYVCSECGSNKNLIAHHKNPCIRKKDRARTILLGNHSTDNGKFLCASCHKLLHNKLKEELPSQKN